MVGRYLDKLPSATPVTGLEFGETLGLTLRSKSNRSQAVANPEILRKFTTASATALSKNPALNQIRAAQSTVVETSREFARASKGTGNKYDYPDTNFGAALRWTGNMIEADSPARLFYVTLGSFESGFSFDTHIEQLAAHASLYTEFGRGLRALAAHLKSTGELQRVQLLTFSDFGRQVAENRDAGTDHGDASILFAMGGKMHAGVHGGVPDLAHAHDGGLPAKIDFRQIYSNVLEKWLGIDPVSVLPDKSDQYPLMA